MGRSMRPVSHYHVHQRSQMCSWINGLQMGSSSPIKFLEIPLRNSRRTYIFVVCIIICNTLPQNDGHSIDQCTTESEKELFSCPSQKCKETHSQTTRERGQQQSLFEQIQEKTKMKGRPYLSQTLPPCKEVLGSKTYLINQNLQLMNEELPQRLQ